ncbi:MAG: hypothetical protein L6R38_005285 [Xanthoria sp. 2 TBL-2021]|nr:MAG: hypothetical protein L6R38_005285 [Xanthoria sp. 2 TBL-2021]
MSYNNGYNNYSPYYQGMTGQDGRGQDSYQNSANSNGRYGYQSSSSQATQRPQQQPYTPQQQQSTNPRTTTSADQSTTTYARYADVAGGISQNQDSRAGYGYAPRSSVDTTALGNLAHASSLGQDSRHSTTGPRDSSSLQQLINYNRSQQSQAYDGSLAYGAGNATYGYGQQLSDSRDSATSRDSHSSRSKAQSQGQTQAPTQHQYSQYGTSATCSNPTPAYAATSDVQQHSSYQATGDDQRQKTQPYYTQPVLPASGQSIRASVPNSHFSPKASQSPTVPTYRTATANTNTSSLTNAYSTPRQQEYSRSSQPSQPTPYAQNRTPSATGQSADKRRSSATSSASKPSVPQPYYSASDSGKHQESTVARIDREAPKSPEEQIPKTVDPSHVFNHYEYQRRQAAAAEAERAKKAAEAEELMKANEAAAALKRVSEGQPQQTSYGAMTQTATKEKEEEMAAEMKLMIEKMRDYKSKDPSLFSQIWEQVKKTQPAGSTPTIPPLSAKDLTGSTISQQSQANGIADDSQIISPSPGLDQSVNGVSKSFSILPDLGKFPAQRRKRGPYKTDGSAKKAKGPKTPAGSPPQVNTSKSSPPIDPALVDSNSHTPQQASNSVQRSPYALPNTANRDVIYVSGTGPPPSPQVHPSTTAPSSDLPPSVTVDPSFNGGTPTPAPVQVPTSGGTTWPEHKKWDLAVAAKNTLVASPINAGRAKNITAEQILGFLNQNPSFEQLCQLIEAQGLIIERSHFARSLLGAIPDIGTSVRQRQQNALASRQSPNARQLNGGSGVPQINGSSYGVSTPKPSNVPQQMKENLQPNGAPTAQMVTAETKALSTQSPIDDKPAVPLTKQQMARKRNISDIVDLSQLSDDDLPPPPKVTRLDEDTQVPADPRPPTAGHDLNGIEAAQIFKQPPRPIQQSPHFPPYGPSPFFNPAQHSPVGYQPPYSPLPPAPYPIPAGPSGLPPTGPPPPSYSTQQRELINSEHLVQPIDKAKAKKRKRYNPKTIVRDVLIAAGRHPTMQPLNYHLEPLRRNFKHVTDISDLSTFKWDLVDPGGPPALGPVVAGVRPAGTADGNDADAEGQYDVPQPAPSAQMTPRADLEAEPSVAVATTTGVPLVSQPPKLLGPQRKRAPENPEQTKSKVDKSWMSSGLNFGRKPLQESAPETPQTDSSRAVSAAVGSGSSGVSRRGRPPKATTQPTPPGARRVGRPPGAKNKHPRKSSGTPQLSSMPTRPSVDTTPARPSGLRNTVASADGIAVVVPSPSPSIAENKPRGRGRPRKSPKSSQQSTPIHRVYKCQWKDCPAELHNLETLKKHVIKHSDRYDGPFPCLWEGCGKARKNDEEDEDKGSNEDESQPLEYATKDIWAKHIDRRHLADYAWKLGDGPSLRSDSEVSDHVSDSARRAGAPIISNAKGRPDPIPLTSSGKPARLYHKAHGITTELGKAEAFLEASEARRRKLGPGMDRTGATFVTKRKNALLDVSVTPLKKVQQSDDDDDEDV